MGRGREGLRGMRARTLVRLLGARGSLGHQLLLQLASALLGPLLRPLQLEALLGRRPLAHLALCHAGRRTCEGSRCGREESGE